jgi:valyl-tRNA synthetase
VFAEGAGRIKQEGKGVGLAKVPPLVWPPGRGIDMRTSKGFDPQTAELRLQAFWQEAAIHAYDPHDSRPIFAIDTPPPTVSGGLHLGHVYSYCQADFMARFWRMNGFSVFYPMGFDDNGLPTERLVERRLGISAASVGRVAFIQKCLEVSEAAAEEYRALWRRLGLSIDWRYTYRTIDDLSRRTAQWSFLDLYRRGLAYQAEAPTIWCPECRTAIAQAELNDLERETLFVTIAFGLEDGGSLPIATTRPELLPACVAVFVHPDDARFRGLVGGTARVPLFGMQVPILEDRAADPQKGTGAVMCCTFGDTTDVAWWRNHKLPLRAAIGLDGRLTQIAEPFSGVDLAEGRRRILEALEAQGLILGRQPIDQSIRVHERCDTPVEYIVTQQWFIRLLDSRQALLDAGERVVWHPAHMKARYRQWVEDLGWDWCISRQRTFGVPFPLWHCRACGEVVAAEESLLPVDPAEQQPSAPCPCGGRAFAPEEGVMDTWATSSLTPQIVGRWLAKDGLYERVFPMSLRPQAHEIIRTWAFYTIVKSLYHFGVLPWKEVAISGWGLALGGTGKISKSKGGGPMSPEAMIRRHSADALRYWSASSGFGKDAFIDEERIRAGDRLVTKLWNVAAFGERFLTGYRPPLSPPPLSPADRWIVARIQTLVRRCTALFQGYDYSAAKNEIEAFFWHDLADNYLEMAKQRLYDGSHEGPRYALYHCLLTTVKLLAPLLPHVTEEIYQRLFAAAEATASVHRSRWPAPDSRLEDPSAEAMGEVLIAIATAVRRYKSERNLALGAQINGVQLLVQDSALRAMLEASEADLASVTRAKQVKVVERLDPALVRVEGDGPVAIAIAGEEEAGPGEPPNFDEDR